MSVDYCIDHVHCTVQVRTSYLRTVSRTVSINSGSAGVMRSYRSISREKIRNTFSRNWLPGAQVWTLISDLYSFYRFYIIPPPPPTHPRSCSLTDWITNQVPFGNKLQFWEWRLMMTDCLSVGISLLTSCHGISFPPVRVNVVFINKSTLLTKLINSNVSIFATRSSLDVLPWKSE